MTYYANRNGTYTVMCRKCGRGVIVYAPSATVCHDCRKAEQASKQPTKREHNE
jgi:uncharacterized OB-fold protein